MTTTALAPLQPAKRKADAARIPALKPHGPAAIPALPDFLGTAGNMAIQRAAKGPLNGIAGGAAMSGGGCSCGGTCAECNKKPVQRKGEGGPPAAGPGFHNALGRSGGGMPLGPHVRGMMESSFGEKFDDVRVHDDSGAADAAGHIHAHAFTTGRDIYFGQGRYEPHSQAGQKLLAHELTHVLQQRRGVVPGGLKSLNATAHDDVFEREAEHAEARFTHDEQTGPASLRSRQGNPHGHGENSGPAPVQRKCVCGGTCSKCSEEKEALTSQELRKSSAQRKPEDNRTIQRKCGGSGTSPKCPGAEEETKGQPVQRKGQVPGSFGKANTAPGGSIQRKCSCGGKCPKCSGTEEETKGQPVQRKGQALGSFGKTNTAPAGPIQRKCPCGGKCPKCSGVEEETKGPAVQRKAEPAISGLVREQAVAARENKPSSEKSGRTEGWHNDRKTGAANQSRDLGSRPVRPGRNAVAGFQRSPSIPSAKAGSNTRNETFEREANAAANDVAQGRRVASEKLSAADPTSVQALDWEWCNPFSDPDCGVGSTASVVAGEASEIATGAWEAAKKLAAAVGGFLFLRR